MGLKFIYGRAGSGKSNYCLTDIKEKIETCQEGSLILMVPEQFSFQAEKNLLKAIGEKGLLKAQVLSFKRMAHVVFNECGGAVHKHMNPAGRSMVLFKILEELKDDLKYFARAGRQQGFVNIMSDIITELKRYSITPEFLKQTEDMISEEELKEKVRDITLIYGKFNEAIQGSYIDPEDDLSLLSKMMDNCCIFDNAEIWMDEFSTFTPQQYEIIIKLLKKAKRVNITLTMDDGRNDEFLPVYNTEQKLLRLIKQNNISYEEPVEVEGNNFSRFKDSTELMHLEKNLFKYPSEKFEEEIKDICLFRALNEYSEVESTARDIIRLCREERVRFNDIAVIARDLSNYSNLIQVIFNQYGIPCFIDEKRQVEKNPVIIMITSMMNIFQNNWSYEAVFAYLKTGLTGISREDLDLLENYVLANGIRGSKWREEWNYSLNYGYVSENGAAKDEEITHKLNELKEIITLPLRKLQASFKEGKSVRGKCTALYEFLLDLNVPEKIQGWIEGFQYNGEQEKSGEYSQIWNMLMELLDQMVSIMGDESIKLEEFAKLLAVGISQYKVGLIPPSLDQVLVGSMERVKSHEVSIVYILGANDGVFPKTSDEEGILSDRDRITLKDYGVEIAQDTKSRALEEQFIMYTTFTIPRKYLRLSYPIGDFEGKTLRPSMVIARIKEIFPKIKEESDIVKKESIKEDLELISRPSPTFNELIYNIRKEAEGIEINPLWWDVYRWYLSHKDWKESCNSVFHGLNYTNQVDFVSKEKIRKLYGNHLQFSVSRLEKYAECPFAYYIEYGLKAKERKIYELNAPDLGSFMHEVLDGFSEKLEENKYSWRDISEEWCAQEVSEIVENQCSNKNGFILSSSPRYRYLLERLKKLLAKSVWTIASHIKSGSFNPMGHEIEFGRSGDFPPIIIKLPDGESISLTGRIDRVDEMVTEEGTYLRIIDYKSGPKNFKLADVYYGLQLQLLVYLDAIISNWELLKKSEAIPGAILYFKLDDPMINSIGEVSEEELQKEVMKKLKMQGLLLKDARIVKEMDKNIQRYSLVIPAQVNSDGSLGGSTSAATKEQFELLREFVRKTVISLCEEMLLGNISIKPCKKKDYIACNSCEFSAICKFDISIKDNKFKILLDRSEDELWKLIEEEVNEEGEADGRH